MSESRRKESEPIQDVFGTPSKLLARHFSSMGLRAHSTGDGGGGLRELIVKIHGLRMHAYTDSILEYRLEVVPAELVRLACAGIQGLRKPADTMYDVLPSESEESDGDSDSGDTGKRKKKCGVGPPPEPDSHLRMWMPACVLRPVLPDLIGRYEAELKAKCAKKSSKGKQRAPPAMKVSSKRRFTTSDDDKAAPGPSKKTKFPCPSPCKVLQRLNKNLNLDVNLCGALPPTTSSPAHKRPPLQPFPMASEEEELSDDN